MQKSRTHRWCGIYFASPETLALRCAPKLSAGKELGFATPKKLFNASSLSPGQRQRQLHHGGKRGLAFLSGGLRPGN